MKISEISKTIENFAPLSLQENYDNSGLLIGNAKSEVDRALITLDVTEEVLDEAVANKCQMIISHHPLIFGGLKRLNGNNMVERIVMAAIKKDIAIYAVHTNIDNVALGVNKKIADLLGLQNLEILKTGNQLLRKLVVFCPTDAANIVREAMFAAGAGHIGNYDSCSYNLEGKGSFRAGEGSNPHVGEINKLHFEEEVRIESIYPVFKEKEILEQMIGAHPYEEVAYDIYPLENAFDKVGSGMIGELEKPQKTEAFLKLLKETFKTGLVKYTSSRKSVINKVAICGGSGSFLIKDAMAAGADIFITGDVKYHDFFLGEKQMIIADIGHYESEQYTKELIFTLLKQKFPTFALQISKVNTNPIKYL